MRTHCPPLTSHETDTAERAGQLSRLLAPAPSRAVPDEDGGCVHEIALTDASVTVRCADLEAVWFSTE